MLLSAQPERSIPCSACRQSHSSSGFCSSGCDGSNSSFAGKAEGLWWEQGECPTPRLPASFFLLGWQGEGQRGCRLVVAVCRACAWALWGAAAGWWGWVLGDTPAQRHVAALWTPLCCRKFGISLHGEWSWEKDLLQKFFAERNRGKQYFQRD